MQLRERSRKFIGPSPTNASSEAIGGKSSEVTIALTPGSFSALSRLIDMIRAWACGLRLTLPQSIPGMTMSAPKLARPVTLSTPSGRMGRVPTTFCNSFGIYVMRTSLLHFRRPRESGDPGAGDGASALDSRLRGNDGVVVSFPLLRGGAQRGLRFVQRGEQPRRRHRQIAQPDPGGIGYGIGDCRHRRHDRYFTNTAGAKWVPRVGHLDHDCVNHRHVRGDRHAIVEEARIFEPSVLVVDVFLAERPANPLGHAALHLAFDIGRMDRAADILDRDIAQDLDVAGLLVDLDIADVGCKPWRLALRVDLHLGADRTAGARCFGRDRGQVERLEAAGIRTGGIGLAVF